jgi:hypothetical protein
VLADASGKHQPIEWAKIAIAAYRAHRADRIANSADSSARVFSPESAAIATRALNSALCCFSLRPLLTPLWTGQPLAYPAVQKSGAAANRRKYYAGCIKGTKGQHYLYDKKV